MSAEPVSGPFAPAPSASPPPTREFGFAWLSYGLTVVGLFLVWPAVIAAIVSGVKRADVRGTLLESHHTWLLRTVGYAVLGYVLCIVLVFIGAWDIIVAAVRATPTGQLNLDWGAILTSAGAAVLGGLGMTVCWFWTIYRVLRGMLRLHDGRAVP